VIGCKPPTTPVVVSGLQLITKNCFTQNATNSLKLGENCTAAWSEITKVETYKQIPKEPSEVILVTHLKTHQKPMWYPKTYPKLNPILVSCSTNNEIFILWLSF